jgi:hypothetical protein
MQDCPGNCSFAGACMLWHDAPRGWYEDSHPDVAPAPEPAADLASKNASLPEAHDGSAQQRRPPNRTAASEYPQCICFPGLGVSIRLAPCGDIPATWEMCRAFTCSRTRQPFHECRD